MKLDPKYKPELCASDDEDRPQLTAPYLDKAAGRVVATTGHLLVAVPVTVEEGDEAQHLPPEDLARARLAEQPAVRPPDRHRGQFPDWKQVVPPFKPFDPGTVCVGLNADYLLRITQAMGARGHQVVLTFDPTTVTTRSPILVTALERPGADDAFGVLMPLRLDDLRPEPPRERSPGELAQEAEEEAASVAAAQRAAELLVLEARKKAHLEFAAQLEDEIEELTGPAAPAPVVEVSGG